jgi:cobalt/nickel transport system permease protein
VTLDATVAAPPKQAKRQKPSFVEKTLAGIAGNIEQAVFSEENARRNGFLQRRDPRVKVVGGLAIILAAALSRDWPILLALYFLVVGLAWVSAIDMGLFFKRVWLGIPLFSGIVIIPSIFFIGGDHHILTIPVGLFDMTVTREGLEKAGVFVIRVGVCVSTAILLILTTKWADILKSLSVLKVPSIFILVLAMAYRYIFLFLHTVNGMFLARKSRTVANTTGREQRWWIVSTIGVLMSRSFKMSEDVYQAMMARGFTDRIVTYNEYHFGLVDGLTLLSSLGVAASAVYLGWFVL